jgi:predicted DNA-binding protein
MESEIEYLKQRIAELEKQAVGKEKPEIVKEVIKEHVEKQPEEFLGAEQKFSQQEIQKHSQKVSELKSGETGHGDQITELLQIAHNRGILNAVSVVRATDDPHLEDEFHDALVKYFQNVKNV